MTKHNLLFLSDDLIAVGLSAQVTVVLEKFPQVDLAEDTSKVACGQLLVIAFDILLKLRVVRNHLEGALNVPVVELCCAVRKPQH